MATRRARAQDAGVPIPVQRGCEPRRWRRTLAPVLLCAILSPFGARAQEPAILVVERSAVTLKPRPGVAREQWLALRAEALAEPSGGVPSASAMPELVRLDLFEDEVVVLERTGGRRLARGGHSWLGKPLGDELGLAVFLVRGDRVYGGLRRPGSNLQIRPGPEGGHRLQELDEAGWPDEPVDYEEVWDAGAGAEMGAPFSELGGPPAQIDVLVVYTAAARAAAGGVEAMEALIELGQVETNASYANAVVDQRIRVVHTQEVIYTESGSSATDLSRLSGTSDGFLDGVHAVRDAYGADFVSLWTETGGCGRGYVMSTVSAGFASSAFNVCRLSCATGNLTFGHELGHNMGLRHDWYVDDTNAAPYSYNHGYPYPAGSWRTVMSYNDLCADLGGGCTRLQRFSNPDELEGGVPTGVAEGTSTACAQGSTTNPPCDADNRKALDNTAATVAAFRATTVLARIAKEVDLAFADIGDTLTYTLTVTNDGPVAATAIEIRDTVPAHTTLVAGSLSPDAGSTGTAAGSLVTWLTGEDLAPGQSLVRTFQVTAGEGGIATNTATVDSSSTSLTVGSNTVRTAIWEAVACGFQEGFEAGELSHHWRVETTEDGRARVLDDLPDTGTYSAVLDDAVSGSTTSLASLDLSADLAGQTDVLLDFRWAEAGDENGAQDGVFIRQADGDAWVGVLPFADAIDLVFQDGSIDLDAAADLAGLTLVDGFQIRFQFEDNFSFNPGNLSGSDGYAIDNVALTCGCSLELTADTVTNTVVHDTPCVIYAGPDYTVMGGGDLTLSSPQGIVLRGGFAVDGGIFSADNDPGP